MGRDLLDMQYVNREGDSMLGPLSLVGDPVLDTEAASKRYVDTVLSNQRVLSLLRDGSQPMLGPLTLFGNPTQANHAVRMAYADAQDALRLLLAGGVMTGDITLAGAPTNNLHPSTKLYTDTADAALAAAIALCVPLDGSVAMTGPLVLPGLPTLPLHAATKGYVDAIPPGQTAYDAIVDAAGGADYTSVATACATELAGAKILIIRGTYNEAGSVTMKDNQMLEGQNPEDTVIDFGGGNFKITNSGAGSNRSIKNLTVQGSIANYTIELNSTYDRVENCRVIGTVNANGGVIVSGMYSIVKDCYFLDFDKVATYCCYLGANYCQAIGNTFDSSQRGIFSSSFNTVIGNHFVTMTNAQIYIGAYTTVVGNEFYGLTELLVSGAYCKIVGNMIRGDINWATDLDFTLIANNTIYLSEIRCNQANTFGCTITGNVFSGGDGVDWNGYGSSITGNMFYGTAHLQFQAGARENVASGNNFNTSTEPLATRITDLGLRGNQAFGNQGVPVTQEKYFSEMTNTSGGGLADGDCVVLKAVAAGDEVDTTVNIGDDMVFGMVNEAIANNNDGQIQTRGFTDMLKVNGVINIGVGDLLGTFNAAGIAQQAQAGDMAFAIALEAYAGADSNGVIDALLITPRKV